MAKTETVHMASSIATYQCNAFKDVMSVMEIMIVDNGRMSKTVKEPLNEHGYRQPHQEVLLKNPLLYVYWEIENTLVFDKYICFQKKVNVCSTIYIY